MSRLPATTSFVQGASRGLGLELVQQLLASSDEASVFASCRNPEDASELQTLSSQSSGRLRIAKLDVSREETIVEAAKQLEEQGGQVALIINVAGVLHGAGFSPEKKLAQVTPEALRTVFEVNAFGPLLVAKHFSGMLRHENRSVFASLSARIGSISDNRLGGWYAYRGSKAAQNMFTKTLSIELGRVAPKAVVIGLHPGTVDTGLSAPFQSGVPEHKLFTPEYSVTRLLAVIDRVTSADTGKVFDFRGDEILP
jgi:NAD(P)-dependent dehydrogenase (short-subunit alcohol dehydrogenase family)